MLLDINYCFKKNNQLIYKDTNEGGIVIDPYRRKKIYLNQIACKIWQKLDGQHSVDSIIKKLKEEFEVDDKQLKKDVIHFLKDLIRREIIK